MFDYISPGPPTAMPPGQSSYALGADVLNSALYISNPATGTWKPTGGGLLANVNLTGQTASIAATTLFTATTAFSGMFAVNWYTKLTTTGTSPVLGPLVIAYTDTDGTSQSVTALGQNQAGSGATSLTATTTTQNLSGSLIINAGAGAITYAFTTSGTIGAAVYELKFRLEYFN